MRYALGCLLALLLCISVCTVSLAEIAFIPEMKTWDWESLPVEVDISADVKTHMPFDENRTRQLNAMLRHVSLNMLLQQGGGESWSSMKLLVDGEDVLQMLQRETSEKTEVQFSVEPQSTYTWPKASGMDLNSLLGVTDAALWLDGSETAWLDDALVTLEALPAALPQHLKDIKYQINVQGMGQAARKQTLIIPPNALDNLKAALVDVCPEGRLRAALEEAVLEGKQTLHILRDGQGGVLRIEWVGQAGLAQDDLRQISLVWRLKRSENESRDDLTLKMPRVRGSGRMDLTLQRTITYTGDTAVMKGKLVKSAQEHSEKRKAVTTDFDLTRTTENGHSRVTGQLDMLYRIGSEEDYDRLVLDTDVAFTGTQESPSMEGSVLVSQYRNKALKEQAALQLSARQGDWMMWELRPSQIAVNEANLEKTAQRILNGMTVALVRKLVLLPQEDTLFLSADLDPMVWKQIVEAAQSALQ